MRTIDLSREEISLSEVLALAQSEAVLIHSASGKIFLLEPADEFAREAAILGGSERFSSFLKARSGESGDVPLRKIREQRGL